MAISNGGQGEGGGQGGAGGGIATEPAQVKWGLIIAIGLGALVVAGAVVLFVLR